MEPLQTPVQGFITGLSQALSSYLGTSMQNKMITQREMGMAQYKSNLDYERASQLQKERLTLAGSVNAATFDEIKTVADAAGRPEIADKLIADAQKNNKTVVNRKDLDAVFKGLGISNQDEKNQYLQQLAGARQTTAQNSVLNTALRYSGAGGAPKAISEATNRIANIQRARAIIDQINSQSGGATIRQRTELAAATARVVNPTGVLTNEQMNLFVPQTLRNKFGNWQEYLTNASTPVNFKSFGQEFGHLLDREEDVNKGIISKMSQGGQAATSLLRNINPQAAQQVEQGTQAIAGPAQPKADPLGLFNQ